MGDESPGPSAWNDTDRIIEFLRERDVPCPQCQYNLRDLTRPRCPECGRELRLGVTLVEPDLRPWITVMVVFCATAGLGGFWIFGLSIANAWPPLLAGIAIIMQALTIPAVPLLILTRRSIMKLRIGTQWRLAGAAVVYVLMSFILLIIAIVGN